MEKDWSFLSTALSFYSELGLQRPREICGFVLMVFAILAAGELPSSSRVLASLGSKLIRCSGLYYMVALHALWVDDAMRY
jgi:hypothetical protein